VNHLARIQEHLPGPYALAEDAVLTRLLDVVALEFEAFQEDLDRMRQSHWIRFAYRLADAEKLGALVGVARLPWENLQTFRARLLPLVKSRLAGALGPLEIKRFVYDYLNESERALSDVDGRLACLLVPGLQRVAFEQAFGPVPDRPLFRPLELRENPQRLKASGVLAARSGRVPYLYRWEEKNRGLDDTWARFRITGLFGGRTTVPVLVNETTGDLMGYAGQLPFGQTLVIEGEEETAETARATLNGADVSDRLFSMRGFTLGVPFTRQDLDEAPLLPRLARGTNAWIFLLVGLYDIRGLNHFFFAIAGKNLREGVFDEAFFNQALFPSGTVARLEMDWVETEPACFEVRVPRYLVAEPSQLAAVQEERPYRQVAEGLAVSNRELHAAGVKAEVRFVPFVETQRQKVRVTLPWKVMDPEKGTAGSGDVVFAGGRFGESSLGGSRFE
jgi:hypothetical protein